MLAFCSRSRWTLSLGLLLLFCVVCQLWVWYELETCRLQTTDAIERTLPERIDKEFEEARGVTDKMQDDASLITPLLNVSRIIYNRVPKCGSTTVRMVIYKMSSINNYSWKVYNNYTRFTLPEPELEEMIDKIFRYRTPMIYDGHIHYINFTRYDKEQPAYINVVRDPLERMASWYYFIRWDHKREMDDTERNRTFDECVKMKLEECVGVKAYFQIVPFFCGQELFCREPSERSLQQAKYNVENHFAVVGVTDDLRSFFRVLQYRFPQFFRGTERIYQKSQDRLWRESKTSHKQPFKFHTRTVMQRLLKHDNDFYYFVKQRFYKQLQQLDSKLHPRENTLQNITKFKVNE